MLKFATLASQKTHKLSQNLRVALKKFRNKHFKNMKAPMKLEYLDKKNLRRLYQSMLPIT